MDPFKGSPVPPHLDATYLRAHGSAGVVSLGLALRSPGDKFE